MYFWMQGFDPSIHHFGETGMFTDIGHRHILISQQTSSSTSGKQGKPMLIDQGLGKGNDAGFITHGKQCKFGHPKSYCKPMRFGQELSANCGQLVIRNGKELVFAHSPDSKFWLTACKKTARNSMACRPNSTNSSTTRRSLPYRV